MEERDATSTGMRILLADSRSDTLSAMRLLLQEHGPEVVGQASCVGDLLAQVHDARPDALLLDWALPGLRGGGLLPALRVLRPGLKVVVLSARPEVCGDAFEAGADAFVSKGEPPERLLRALGVLHSRNA